MTLEARHAILDALLAVLDEEHARAVIEYRSVTVKKPLTAYGAKRLAQKLAAWGNANAAADIMIDRCWQGFDASWVRDRRPFSASAPPAETVGSLSKRQLFEQRQFSDAPDDTTGRVVQIDTRRLDEGSSAPRSFAISGNLLGRI